MKANSSTGFIIIIILLLATSFFSLNLFFQERSAHDRVNVDIFPYRIGGWKGIDLKIEEYEYKILETRNLIVRDYENPKGERINLFIVYSETNRSVFHPPEVCFLGGGIVIVDKKVEKVQSGGYNFTVNKMFAEKGDFREIVLYTYKAGKLYTSNFYLQQTYLAINQIFGKRTPGATIRVSMGIASDENKILASLKSFLIDVVRIVDSL